MKRTVRNTLILILIGGLLLFYLNKRNILGEGLLNKEASRIVNGGTTNEYINEDINEDIEEDVSLLLVNENYGLSKDYKPKNLVIPDILFSNWVTYEEKHVDERIVEDLENLIYAAKAEGIILLGNSGYRSYKSQKNLFKDRVLSQGRESAEAYVAKPGYSEHQTGLAIDITNEENYLTQGSKEAIWLEENCHKFGFIIRYPYGKEDITGIEYEPWHIRYVGKEAAKYIYDNGITLEEYLGR